MTLLAYHLVRITATAAALLYDTRPRQISFTGTRQYILASWADMVRGRIPPDRLSAHGLALLSRIATCEVGDRPGRLEPRVLRRRRHNYKLLQEPRPVLKNRLESGNAKA